MLELALSQEQSASCDRIIAFAEQRAVELILPAFSLAEPYYTLHGRARQRADLSNQLGKELEQLARSAPLADQMAPHREAVAFLLRVGEDEATNHQRAVERLLQSSRLLPLNRATIEASWNLAATHGLRGPDAVILASVLADLQGSGAEQKLFLNRNVKDFDDPDIVALLAAQACSLLPNFDAAVARIEAALRGGG